MVLSFTPCFIRSFSNQVKFYDSSNMFHTFPCYTLFLTQLCTTPEVRVLQLLSGVGAVSMSEMCHLYSVTCHIVYIVKSYSKSFSFHHLSQKHTKKIEKIEKMLLRIHPPNQGYLKAHSLYSNHFFRLVCSIAITTQKKESHCSLNVRCRCMSFICSVISTRAPVSVAWPRS